MSAVVLTKADSIEYKMEEQKPEQQIFLSNDKFEIPEEGMLGLLAIGDIGLKLWRQKRKEIEDKRPKTEDGNEEKNSKQ